MWNLDVFYGNDKSELQMLKFAYLTDSAKTGNHTFEWVSIGAVPEF